MSLGLSLSLGSPNWREELWCEIYDRARKRNKIKQAKIGPWEFEYAIINPKDRYSQTEKSSLGDHYRYSSGTRNIKEAEEEGCIGKNVDEFCFVLENCAPSEFQDFVGLHEYIETQNGGAHDEACLVELTELFKMDTDFIRRYAEWIYSLCKEKIDKNNIEGLSNGYFGRALPEFLDYLIETEDSPEKILENFKQRLEESVCLDENISAKLTRGKINKTINL